MKTQEEYALEIDEIVRRDVEDVDGNKWSINRYENDILTAGCHRIAYSEMESIAKQLGWA